MALMYAYGMCHQILPVFASLLRTVPLVSKVKHDISCSQKKQSSKSAIVLPNKILKIEESPPHELYGHSSDVMDLAWSNSDVLLSSSMDKTVRMWKIGCNQSMFKSFPSQRLCDMHSIQPH